MDIQAIKLELVKQILATEREDLLDKLLTIVKQEEKDFWNDLSDAQKREVEIGLRQIETGETEAWDDFLKRVS